MRIYERSLYFISLLIVVLEGGFQAYESWLWDDEELSGKENDHGWDWEIFTGKRRLEGSCGLMDVSSPLRGSTSKQRRRLAVFNQCTEAELSDVNDQRRYTKCSTMESCWDDTREVYDNDMCSIPQEKCARWYAVKSGALKLYEGCLQSSFCDKGGYWGGQGVYFKCAGGSANTDTDVVEQTDAETGEPEVDPHQQAVAQFLKPTSAQRWISNDDAHELYLRGGFGITGFYFILSIIASRKESIRATQMPNVIGFYAVWIWKIVANVYFSIDQADEDRDTFSDIEIIKGRQLVAIIFILFTAISIFWFFRLGEANFIELRSHTGPYGIGLKVFWTKNHQNHTLVYYPISRVEWERAYLVPEKYFIPWNLFGEKGSIQMQINMQWFMNSRKDEPMKHVNLNKSSGDPFFNGIKIQAKHNAIFDMNAAALNGDPLKLTPIIFSHGFMTDSAYHSQHCLELASHGYIVFVMNHNDGTCNYTEKSNGEPVFFEKKYQMWDQTVRKHQVDRRIKEISALINEMEEKNYLGMNLQFPKNIQLDLSTLSVMGHSFGGLTAIAAAAKDDRIKAVCAMDAFFYPYKDNLNEIVLTDTPLFHLRSQNYFKETSDVDAWSYDTEQVSDKYFFDLKQENFLFQRVSIERTIHTSQTDIIMMMPWLMNVLMACWCMPDNIKTIAEKYMAVPWLQIEFLYNVGVINQFSDISSCRVGIRKVNKYLDYQDRFYGKDGVYVPHRTVTLKEREAIQKEASIVPFTGYANSFVDKQQSVVDLQQLPSQILSSHMQASFVAFGETARRKSIAHYKGLGFDSQHEAVLGRFDLMEEMHEAEKLDQKHKLDSKLEERKRKTGALNTPANLEVIRDGDELSEEEAETKDQRNVRGSMEQELQLLTKNDSIDRGNDNATEQGPASDRAKFQVEKSKDSIDQL